MYTFPQSYVGQVNVVGDCYCFGAVCHQKAQTSVPVFLSVTGAASSVEALWARMAQGKVSAILRDNNQPSIPLEPEEKGMYTRIQKKVEGLGIDHLFLLHREVSEPEYPTSDQIGQLYMLWLNDTVGIAKLGEHVRKTVKVAVFDEWFAHLHKAGRARGLVRPLRCLGGVEAVQLLLNPMKWTELIADGLKRGDIRLTQEPNAPVSPSKQSSVTTLEATPQQIDSTDSGVYPATLDTPAKRALYDQLAHNEALTLAVDAEIQHTKKDDWRSNRLKEREVRLVIHKHVGDEALTDRILELVKLHQEY
ncbi:MAG: hypothetical protein ACYDBJ_10260 [Aggregatilineales bacterium]